MTDGSTISVWNTGVPLMIAGAMGWIVPRLLAPDQTRSHRVVAISVAVSAVALVAVSAGLFAAFEWSKLRGVATGGGVGLALEVAVRGSILFALAWAPILLLSWFGMAQRVELLRGRDMAAGGDT